MELGGATSDESVFNLAKPLGGSRLESRPGVQLGGAVEEKAKLASRPGALSLRSWSRLGSKQGFSECVPLHRGMWVEFSSRLG